jgi:hypothetical protein
MTTERIFSADFAVYRNRDFNSWNAREKISQTGMKMISEDGISMNESVYLIAIKIRACIWPRRLAPSSSSSPQPTGVHHSAERTLRRIQNQITCINLALRPGEALGQRAGVLRRQSKITIDGDEGVTPFDIATDFSFVQREDAGLPTFLSRVTTSWIAACTSGCASLPDRRPPSWAIARP